jgi:hypothetical protein
VELIADDPAGATFHTPFIREDHPPVWLRRVAGCRAAVDALLKLTLQADIMIDDANVRPVRVYVEAGNRQLAFQSGSISDAILYHCHRESCFLIIRICTLLCSVVFVTQV